MTETRYYCEKQRVRMTDHQKNTQRHWGETLSRRTLIAGGVSAALMARTEPVRARARTPTIIASGGGLFPRDLLKKGLSNAGGRRAQVLVCPYAARDPQAAVRFAEQLFADMGTRSLQVLDLSSATRALEQVRSADLVWYSGGYQKRQVLAIASVKGLGDALRQAHRAGVVMAGGSAGAAVMSKLMISGGRNGTAYTRAGLGFLPNTVLDQHVIARQREWRLRQVIGKNRDTSESGWTKAPES